MKSVQYDRLMILNEPRYFGISSCMYHSYQLDFMSFSLPTVRYIFLFLATLLSIQTGYSQACTTGCTTSVTSLTATGAAIITTNNTVLCIRASTSRAITISGNNVTLCIASGVTLSSNISFSGSPTNLTINNFGIFNSNLNGGLPSGTVVTNAGTWSGNINTTYAGGSITNSGTWGGSISTFTTGTITNTGAWGGNISNFNSGTFNNNNGGSYNTNLALSGTAVFNNNSGSSFTSNSITLTIGGSSVFNNYTTLNKPFTINGGTFHNRSTGSINTAVTFNSGTFTNDGSATITNGTFDVNGTMTSTSGSTLNFMGNVDINSSGSLTVANNVNFQIGGNLTNNAAFSTQSNVTVGGTFTTNSNATSTIQNAGLTANGLTTNNGTLTVTNGALTLKAGLVNNSNDVINLNNSLVTVTGNFTNNGTVNNTGVGCVGMKVSGTSTQNSGGVFGTTGGSATDICTGGSGGFTTNFGTLRNTTTCSCSVNPLPVTFISFTGTAVNETVVLKWHTAKEENNRAFVIERSADGKNFQPLAEVSGNGTTQQVSTYQFIDATPVAGFNYYRIKQIDFDNTESYYSKVIVVKLLSASSQTVLAPNPAATPNVSVNFAKVPETLTVTVVDVKGTIRYSQKYDQPQTENQLPVQNLERGVYVVVVQTNGRTETMRLIKL